MATKLSSLVMKNYFIEEMSQIIDEERKITHEKFADKMENVLSDEKMYKQLKFPADVSFFFFVLVRVDGENPPFVS